MRPYAHPASPAPLDWAKRAIILQPWSGEGREHVFVKQRKQALGELRAMRINTLVLIPPAAHNHMSRQRGKRGRQLREHSYSPQEFKAALADYRRHGIRVILYTCHYHVGHDPSWHGLIKKHPDWLLRDRNGKPLIWHGGDCWLCPNHDEALAYTLNYTQRLVQDYQPDGILLDNNFFPRGNSFCFCANCRRKFRAYICARYRAADIRRNFGVPPDKLDIPTAEGALKHEWIEYRFHVLREIQRRTNDCVKAARPDILFFSNAGYGGTWGAATEETFDYQDVVFCEGEVSLMYNGIRQRLARALGGFQKPSWQYPCYWTDQGLMAPDLVKAFLAAIISQQAHPWIVPFYWERRDSAPALAAMRTYLQFYRRYQSWFVDAAAYAETAVVFSRQTRDHDPNYTRDWRDYYPMRGSALALAELHEPFDILIDRDLTNGNLAKYKTVLFFHPSCLSDPQAAALKAYVRGGGNLVMTQDIGSCDPMGGKRKQPALADLFRRKLGADGQPAADFLIRSYGRGKAVFSRRDNGAYYDKYRGISDRDFLVTTIRKLNRTPLLVAENASPTVNIVPYFQTHQGQTRCCVHLFNSGITGQFKQITIRLKLPRAFKPRQVVYVSPDFRGPRQLPFRKVKGNIMFTVPELRIYGIVLIT